MHGRGGGLKGEDLVERARANGLPVSAQTPVGELIAYLVLGSEYVVFDRRGGQEWTVRIRRPSRGWAGNRSGELAFLARAGLEAWNRGRGYGGG